MTLLLLGILVLEFGSLGILRVEQHAPGANITAASDALWYVVETISTVRYGDQFPVTNAGRTLVAVIIVIGVGIFGTSPDVWRTSSWHPSRRRPSRPRATSINRSRC